MIQLGTMNNGEKIKGRTQKKQQWRKGEEGKERVKKKKKKRKRGRNEGDDDAEEEEEKGEKR